MREKTFFYFSLILAGLIIYASCTGILTADFYSLETDNWKAQSIGQDYVDLFLITPLLLITSYLARGNSIAKLIWGGLILYITYTFVIFCFAVHFNKLFFIYCLILGLAFYLLMFFLLFLSRQTLQNKPQIRTSNIIAVYFGAIALIFYMLWMIEIVPALIDGNIPKSVADTGLFTNAVHVLDLSIFLPGVLITAFHLYKKHNLSQQITPMILTFFILMDITIAVLVIMMKKEGIDGSWSTVVIMSIMALVSLALLKTFYNEVSQSAILNDNDSGYSAL